MDAKHYAVHPEFLRDLNFLLHRGEFACGINKIAAVRPNHRENGNANPGARHGHKFGAWSHATSRQVAAKLDAIRSAAFRSQRRLNRFNADFQQEFLSHVQTPCPTLICVSVLCFQFQKMPSSAARFQPHRNRRISLVL